MKNIRARAHWNENRERINASRRARRAGEEYRARRSIADRLNARMGARMLAYLRGAKARTSWRDIVGYEVGDLRLHLERQFLKGMSWENMGEWHIDHIVPLSSFTITGPDDPELRRAWALTNLRPLWAGENCAKGAKRLNLI